MTNKTASSDNLEFIDLRELYDKQFLIALRRSDGNTYEFSNSLLIGPFSFDEMVENVPKVYSKYLIPLTVVIISKDMNRLTYMLDENTVDYIHTNWMNILEHRALDVQPDDSAYTAKAGYVYPES